MTQSYVKTNKNTTSKPTNNVEVEKHANDELVEACFSVPYSETCEGSLFNNSLYLQEIEAAYLEFVELEKNIRESAIKFNKEYQELRDKNL